MIVFLHRWLDFLGYWWHEVTTSRYVRYLERDNKRLQEQNLALWNTVWGVRGMPGQVQSPTSRLASPGGAPADMPMAVRQDVARIHEEMRKVPADTPTMVRSRTKPNPRREAEQEALKAERTQQKDKIEALRLELNDQIERERQTRKGEGYAVIGTDNSTPVAIVEPPDEVTLLDEPEDEPAVTQEG